MRLVENSLPKIRNTLALYRKATVFNMDETAFFYQLIPDRSLAIQLWEGGKQSKHRMTVVVLLVQTRFLFGLLVNTYIHGV